MLTPLLPGTHTIQFAGRTAGGFPTGLITYTLIVVIVYRISEFRRLDAIHGRCVGKTYHLRRDGPGLAYEEKGMFNQALTHFYKAQKLADARVSRAHWHVYARSGKPEWAKSILAELHRLSRTHHFDPFFFTTVHARLGENGPVFNWLEKACRERSEVIIMLKVDPRFDGIRSDPRFTYLVRRIGLPL
jgi:hypothetical protein